MRKIWQAIAVITSSVGIATISLAAALSNHDTEFLQQAAESGRLEIEASKLAHQYSGSPQVREFAEMMITEHTEVDRELNALAANKNVSLPTKLPDDKQRNIAEWQGVEANELNSRYIKEIAIDAHEEAIDRFKKAAKDASDPDVKKFAEKTLPSLQHHLARGKLLQQELDAASKRGPAARQDAERGRATSPATPDNTGTGGGEPTNEPPPESPNKAANPQ